MDSIISIENLNFKYEDRWILKDINLEIPKGVFVAVLGPNGCGKSTLLKNICCAVKPQTGNVNVKGRNIGGLRPKQIAREIAVVHQNANMNFGLSCREVVLMGRYAYQSTWKWQSEADDEITEESMRYCGVWQFRDKSITALSGGEVQRVMIAKALAQQTEILLMDEPVASLDLKYQVEILRLCKTLIDEKQVTIVAPIHDINMALQFTDMTIILKQGKVVEFGRTKQVVSHGNLESLYDVNVRKIEDRGGDSYYFPAI